MIDDFDDDVECLLDPNERPETSLECLARLEYEAMVDRESLESMRSYVLGLLPWDYDEHTMYAEYIDRKHGRDELMKRVGFTKRAPR